MNTKDIKAIELKAHHKILFDHKHRGIQEVGEIDFVSHTHKRSHIIFKPGISVHIMAYRHDDMVTILIEDEE